MIDGQPMAFVPAGERWPDGSFSASHRRPAGCSLPCSPEAEVARNAFRNTKSEVGRLIRASVSGRELIERGFADDVDMAVALEVSVCAPLLAEGAYRPA
jgi:2-phosphosulfolactate phosphatase